MKTNTILQGDVRQILRGLPSESIDCIVTSPPYWSLRNYNTPHQIWGGKTSCKHRFAKNSTCTGCGAWRGELGLEPDFKMFVDHLILVFAEVKRVMKPTGTVFVNLNDTYGGSSHGASNETVSGDLNKFEQPILSLKDNGSSDLQSSSYNKSLLGIPDRFKIAMVDELGFKCRNEIIWQKPNATPQSATDRFTNDFEKIYFFTLQNNYNFNQILEKYTEGSNRWGGDKLNKTNGKYDIVSGNNFTRERSIRPNLKGRNKRTVWRINTSPSGIPHYATYPEELPETCILAGCLSDGVVLDPFAGGGTTLKVAERLSRKWIGIELNPEYIKLAETRLHKCADAHTCKAYFENRRKTKIKS
jgi:site-specific DNA-methyltransferase (cytosine-N4-specific)